MKEMRYLLTSIKRLSLRSEIRQIGMLTCGSVLAQMVSIATAPLLSRLYSPSDFGIFALFLTVATIGGAVGGLCYEVAVILPRSRRAATALFSLALILSFLTPALIIGIIVAVQHLFPQVFGSLLTNYLYIICGFCIMFTTQFNTLGYAHSRVNHFGTVATSRVSQTLFTSLVQIGLATIGLSVAGLLIGRAIGLLGSVALLCRNLPRGFRITDFGRVNIANITAAAKTYRDFLLQVPRQLLVRSGSALPSALLLGAYGPEIAGLYFFAVKLVERPGMLLGDTLTRVPLKQFADRCKRRAKLTRAALLYTAGVGLPVILCVAILAIAAHPLFRIAFGAQWEPAADYAIVLGSWAAIRLVCLPVATLTTVLRVQKHSFYVDALFSLRVLAIPLAASQGRSAITAISIFCALSVIYHLTIFAVGLCAAIGYDRKLTSNPGILSPDQLQAGGTYG